MKISDKVICIDDIFPLEGREVFNKLPQKNQIYCVRSIESSPTGKGIYIKLVGIYAEERRLKGTNIIFERGFKPERFRTIEEIKNKNVEILFDNILHLV